MNPIWQPFNSSIEWLLFVIDWHVTSPFRMACVLPYWYSTFILRYSRTVFYRVRFLFFCTAQGPIFRSRCRRRNWTVSRTLGLFDTVNRTAHTVFWAPYRTEFYVRNRRPQYENTTSVRFRTYCDGIAKKSDRGSDPVDPTSFSTTVGFKQVYVRHKRRRTRPKLICTTRSRRRDEVTRVAKSLLATFFSCRAERI